jgi:hypothetical protein
MFISRIWPLHLTLILVGLLLWISSFFAETPWTDFRFLHATNFLLFLFGFISLFIQERAIDAKNPNVFLRSVLGGTMIKMFGMVIVILAYVMWKRESYDAASIFVSMIFYLIYLSVEVIWLMKKYRTAHA